MSVDLRIARFTYDGKETYGILHQKSLIDLKKLLRLKNTPGPSSIEELIFLDSKAEELLEGLTDEFSKMPEKRKRKMLVDLEDIVLKAPITSPPKIICLGLNYRDHAEEAETSPPDEPIFFMKPRTSIIGPEESIVKPKFVERLDYEVELAIIIGRKGRNIPVSEAEDYIFGYTVFNDISAREIQFRDGQWTRGKSFDTFAPIGPCITTSKQIGDPTNLQMYTRVNGEIRQKSTTKNMIFNVYEIVHHISRVMTLEPCDIIATGTPAGVAAFMKPISKFLKPGDIVEVEIEKIGKLKNYVTEA